MKKALLILSLIFGTANAAPMDMDGNIIEHSSPVLDIVSSCAADGYFVHGTILFMCTIIRTDVEEKQITAYEEAYKKRMEERFMRFFKGE